jgi:hypothetical protein
MKYIFILIYLILSINCFCQVEVVIIDDIDITEWETLKSKGIIDYNKLEDYRGFSEGFAATKMNGKWGFINKKGEQIIPFEYEYVSEFSEGLVLVMKNGLCGFVDSTGKTIIPFEYENGGGFYNGLAAVKKNGKYGFIDNKNHIVIDFQFQKTNDFRDGLCIVMNNNKYGLINNTGKLIIPFLYDDISIYDDSLYKIEINHNKGFINKKGELLITAKYDHIDIWDKELKLCKVRDKQNNKYGIVNLKGEVIIPCIYNDYDNYDNKNYIKAYLDKLYTFYTLNGKKIFTYDYPDWAGTVENYLIHRIDYKIKDIYNLNGEKILSKQYDQLYIFRDTLILKIDEELFERYDNTGKYIGPYDYYVGSKENNSIMLEKNDTCYIYDLQGVCLLTAPTKSITTFYGGYIYTINNKKGILFTKNNFNTTAIYDNAIKFDSYNVKVTLNNRTYVLNEEGEEIK